MRNTTESVLEIGSKVRAKRSGWEGFIFRRGFGFDAWGVCWNDGSIMNMFGYELELR